MPGRSQDDEAQTLPTVRAAGFSRPLAATAFPSSGSRPDLPEGFPASERRPKLFPPWDSCENPCGNTRVGHGALYASACRQGHGVTCLAFLGVLAESVALPGTLNCGAIRAGGWGLQPQERGRKHLFKRKSHFLHLKI